MRPVHNARILLGVRHASRGRCSVLSVLAAIGIDHVSPVSSLITSSPLTYILGVSNPFGSTSIRTTDPSPRRRFGSIVATLEIGPSKATSYLIVSFPWNTSGISTSLARSHGSTRSMTSGTGSFQRANQGCSISKLESPAQPIVPNRRPSRPDWIPAKSMRRFPSPHSSVVRTVRFPKSDLRSWMRSQSSGAE